MNPDNLLNGIIDRPDLFVPAGVAAVAALLLAAWLFRRKARSKLSRRVTAAATLLGLGWSAQGMWDTAVHHYRQDVWVASVLFVVFEAMLAARMLKAHQYRTDFARRARHVASVWVIACVMALVVALGEGPEQAPARLAIPLLVAYGWYVDLTADDKPDEKPRTSFRWTPRRLGLLIGMLEPEKRDAQTIDRDRLRTRMTRLAFRKKHGAIWVSDALRRASRLQRLQSIADEADISNVRARLARSQVDLWTEALRVQIEQPKTIEVPSFTIRRRTEVGKQGVHTRGDKVLRGAELRADVIDRMLASVGDRTPNGMTTAALAELYDPPLRSRTAETLAAEARRMIRDRVNGHTHSAREVAP